MTELGICSETFNLIISNNFNKYNLTGVVIMQLALSKYTM